MQRKAHELFKLGLVATPMLLQPLLGLSFLIMVSQQATQIEYGALAFNLVILSMIVSFSDLGLRDYLLSRDAIENGLSKGANLLFPSLAFFLILAAIAFSYISASDNTEAYVLLFAALLPECFALGILQKAIFFSYQTENRISRYSVIDAICKIAPFITKILAYWSFDNLVISVAAGASTAFILYTIWFFRVSKAKIDFFKSSITPAESLVSMLRMWHNWMPFAISYASFFLYFGADRILVEAFLGTEQLAIFASACAFIAAGQIVVNAIWSLYMPRLSRREDIFGRKKLLLFASILSGLMFISYQGFATYVFDQLYPENYSAATNVISVMSFYFLFRIINVVYEMYWVAENRYHLFVKLRVASGIFSVVANIILIPRFGILAPAFVLVFAEAMMSLLILLSERRRVALTDSTSGPIEAAFREAGN